MIKTSLPQHFGCCRVNMVNTEKLFICNQVASCFMESRTSSTSFTSLLCTADQGRFFERKKSYIVVYRPEFSRKSLSFLALRQSIQGKSEFLFSRCLSTSCGCSTKTSNGRKKPLQGHSVGYRLLFLKTYRSLCQNVLAQESNR